MSTRIYTISKQYHSVKEYHLTKTVDFNFNISDEEFLALPNITDKMKTMATYIALERKVTADFWGSAPLDKLTVIPLDSLECTQINYFPFDTFDLSCIVYHVFRVFYNKPIEYQRWKTKLLDDWNVPIFHKTLIKNMDYFIKTLMYDNKNQERNLKVVSIILCTIHSKTKTGTGFDFICDVGYDTKSRKIPDYAEAYCTMERLDIMSHYEMKQEIRKRFKNKIFETISLKLNYMIRIKIILRQFFYKNLADYMLKFINPNVVFNWI